MQIRTPALSGNQQQASSLPENCRPVVTKGKEERETEREIGRERETHLSICRIPPPTT